MSKRRHSPHRGRKTRKRSEKKATRSHERSEETFRGRVQKNPRGFAFLLPLHAEFEDVFVSRNDAMALLEGDIVEFSVVHRGPKSSARIHRVLERRQSQVMGRILKAGRGLALVTSNNETFSVTGDTEPGQWAVADLKELPSATRAGVAAVTKNLGVSLSPKQDIPFTIARFGLPESFSGDVLKEADRYRSLAQDEFRTKSDRQDLRHLPFVTIDGEDAKDFDDAIFVESTAQGFTLYVAIADVSFFVTPHTQLDEEARERATSVYFPGFCLPMLPEYLSNDLCSLRPKEDKLALTAEIQFSPDGNAHRSRFYTSYIKTAARLTYTQVQAFFDKNAATLLELAPLAEPLRNALALYHKLDDQRRRRGVLDFNLPESKIQVDDQGRPISVSRAPRFVSHKLIEEFMIAANRAVAKFLREKKAPSLYRVHEPPDAESLQDLNLLLRNLGLPGHIQEVSPRAFAKVLESTAELASASTVHHVILRLQKQARYIAQPLGHFGLSLADYTHFTSPIRRYPDLVVHRSLKGLIAGGGKTDKRTEGVSEDWDHLGEHTSEMERRATEAERFIVRRKQCWYFLDRIGDVFEGVVGGVTKNGVFVALSEMAAEGFVPLEFMDGFYQYDERRMCLRKRPGNQTLSLGDSLRVQVVRVSVEDNQITLGLINE